MTEFLPRLTTTTTNDTTTIEAFAPSDLKRRKGHGVRLTQKETGQSTHGVWIDENGHELKFDAPDWLVELLQRTLHSPAALIIQVLYHLCYVFSGEYEQGVRPVEDVFEGMIEELTEANKSDQFIHEFDEQPQWSDDDDEGASSASG